MRKLILLLILFVPLLGFTGIQTKSITLENIPDIAEVAAESVVSLRVSIHGEKRVKLLYKDKVNGMERFHIKPKILGYDKKVGDGSGFIINNSGYIVTNAHVVTPKIYGRDVKPSKIEAILNDGRVFKADIIGTDADSDIAVIKIKADNLKPIQWANSDKIRPGEFALTIGSSLGAEHTVGFGIISAVSRKKPQVSKEALLGDLDYIQTYAQINPGNSGGPLINTNGKVLGITSFIQIAPHSPGFAIPANYAKGVVTALIQDGYVARPTIGVIVDNYSPPFTDKLSIFSRNNNISEENKHQGVLIRQVLSNTPADKAGLQSDDIITAVNNTEVTSAIEFIKIIRTSATGTEHELKIKRNNREITIKVTSESSKKPQ